MNTKDFLRLGVPLGQATRRATDFISKFVLGGRPFENPNGISAISPGLVRAGRARTYPGWPCKQIKTLKEL